jgi:FHA domain
VFVPKPPKKLKGRPTFDARGNAIWKFAEKSDTEVKTANVRALAEGLSLEGPSQAVSLDPYNQALTQGEEKPKGRSLDDMRRLNEQMKREHEELVRKLRTGKTELQPAGAGAARGGRVRLRVDDREMLVDEQCPSVSIGRSEDNDVVVEGERVSRQHARIEFRGHKLVLIDLSANGTFLQTAGGEVSRICRRSARLDGQGMIGVGRRPKPGSPHTIHFVCEEV